MPNEPVLSDKQFSKFMDHLGETLTPAISAGAEQALQELDLAATPSRRSMTDDGSLAEADRTERFFKAVFTGDHMTAKALSESTTTAGGFLVPQGFRSEVIRHLPQLSELAPYVRTVPVVSDAGSLPSLATDISITWRSTSTGENAAFGASDPVFGQVAWALKRADAITKLSRELVADSGAPVVEFVTSLFREAIAQERDRVIAVGDGSSEPYGLSTTAGISAVAVDAALSFSSLVEIEQSLARKYRTRGRWIMNGTNLRRAYSLVDSQSRPIFIRDMVGGVPESRILGYPVSQQDDLPDGTILFGDLSYYLWFDRGEMGIESTNEGGDAFANHQTWIKVWERVDGKVALPEAFVKGTGITG